MKRYSLPVTRQLMLLAMAIPCLLPAACRIFNTGTGQPAGIVSDVAIGLLLYSFCLISGRWWRAGLLAGWTVVLLASMELQQALQRLPVLQDAPYLLDVEFLRASTAKLHFSSPGFVFILFASSAAALLPDRLKSLRVPLVSTALAALLLALHGGMDAHHRGQSVVERFHPLHWLVADTLARSKRSDYTRNDTMSLPPNLSLADLQGKRLTASTSPMNVLLITLEGIPGFYLKEIAQAMGETTRTEMLPALAAEVGDAMLVPDFVVHSHQTIRGLYALHCGDFSKLSFQTPKATELELAPLRAEQCLPAQLAKGGWSTHYLQGAGLGFMNKDRAMPAMGFEQVHGLEWFSDRTDRDFLWGTTDGDFFRGVRRYVGGLMEKERPWFLSLLTVATHQPFAASEESLQKYGSPKRAAIADLDTALADFLSWFDRQGGTGNTLIIITADESHGGVEADWYSSWGLAIVKPPTGHNLPRLKRGTYGLVDIEASILDYLNLPIPVQIAGRSLFRDYGTPREMISFTAGKIRWQKTTAELFECATHSDCMHYPGGKIIGRRPVGQALDGDKAERLWNLAAQLDRSIVDSGKKQVFEFGDAARRDLPKTLRNEWADNLIGAQYLGFAEGSKVTVDIDITALLAPPEGVQLDLVLRQFEKKLTGINVPPIPRLKQGETASLRFSFTNDEERQAFSFHLVGESRQGAIRIGIFRVTVEDEARDKLAKSSP